MFYDETKAHAPQLEAQASAALGSLINADTGDAASMDEIEREEQKSTAKPRSLELITADLLMKKKQEAVNFWEIGSILIEAKEQLKHGEWRLWLTEKAEYLERTAQRYMRVAREFSNPTLVSDLGLNKTLEISKLPSGEIAAFIEDEHEIGGEKKLVREMTLKEIKRAVENHSKDNSNADINIDDTNDDKDDEETEAEYVQPQTQDHPSITFVSKLEQTQTCISDMLAIIESNPNDPDIEQDIVVLRTLCEETLEKIRTMTELA